MKICVSDATPLVWSLEQAGAEWHCLACGRWFPLFETREQMETDELVRLHQALTDRVAAGERGPVDVIMTPPPAAPADGNIKCDGCGKDSGRTLQQGKPSAWYRRSDADGPQTACSRACIAAIAAATGKTRTILPW